ncbi:beta-1,4-N-acetylgalactosaminyltransferase bre-4 isoform X2 [Lingula anatina]|nr:beta-1,4-N-acetylgalactosaminyltransferase bre-4 isoform X2 [Lingula anatina]|eukprot:XP_013412932.1 beta-1,4-N-acetylgalactosaminyltransferase bre-4 isoform X2 [Lingula anatina]
MVNLNPPSWRELENKFKDTGLLPGGLWRPKNCNPNVHVAIIIPFRGRDSQLRVFLNNMIPLFQKQNLDYGIFVVDQREGPPFNRAMLMNIGFMESSKLGNYNCFIFHDVDLIAENEFNIYRCAEKPRHMSVLIDKYNYKVLYKDIFGGVTALTREHMQKVNGFSNVYFGWGGEDDDMSKRIRDKNGPGLSSVPGEIGRYKMIKHQHEKSNPINSLRWDLLKSTLNMWKSDGLSSLEGRYSILKLERRPLYTWMYTDVDEKAILWDDAMAKYRKNSWVQYLLTLNHTFITASPSISDGARTIHSIDLFVKSPCIPKCLSFISLCVISICAIILTNL